MRIGKFIASRMKYFVKFSSRVQFTLHAYVRADIEPSGRYRSYTGYKLYPPAEYYIHCARTNIPAAVAAQTR